MAHDAKVAAEDWFQMVTGHDEPTWLESRVMCELPPIDGRPDLGPHLGVIRDPDGKIWDAGAFSTWSLGDKQAVIRGKKAAGTPKPVHVHVRSSRDTAVDPVEVSRLQAGARGKRRHMFQVASNFNGLEVAHVDCVPDSGAFVTGLMTDGTQGPAAITRTHAAFWDAATPVIDWGQTFDRQVELLGAPVLRPYFPVINGKVFPSRKQAALPSLPKPSHADWARLQGEVRVGLHSGAAAYFSRTSNPDVVRLHEPPTVIDQVFVAGMDVRAPGVNRMPVEDRLTSMHFLLEAAYHGTYFAACMQRSSGLTLTCVGGGVFGNPPELVARVMAQAHARWSPLCTFDHVELPLFPVPAMTAVFLEAFAKTGTPVKMTVHS